MEAWTAYALLRLGRVDAARSRVATFSPVPPSSQWATMNLAVEHLVVAETDGCEASLRTLAPRAAERVARRPSLAADLAILFALLELCNGQPEGSEVALDLAVASVTPLFNDLAVARADIHECGPDDRRRLWDEQAERLSAAQRWQNNATVAPGVLANAIARWS